MTKFKSNVKTLIASRRKSPKPNLRKTQNKIDAKVGTRIAEKSAGMKAARHKDHEPNKANKMAVASTKMVKTVRKAKLADKAKKDKMTNNKKARAMRVKSMAKRMKRK